MSWSGALLRAARAACVHQPVASALIRSSITKVNAHAVHQAASVATSGFTASVASQLQRSLQRSATTFASSRLALQSAPVLRPHFDAPAVPSIVSVASIQTDSTDGSVSQAGGAGSELSESADESESNKVRPHRHIRPKRPPDKADHDPDDGDDDNFVPGSVEGDPGNVYILSRSERRQRTLAPADAAWLWQRAEGLAADGTLVRVRVGKAGPHPKLLAAIGDALEAHELVRVDVAPGLDPAFIGWLVENTQDAVLIRSKGRTLTLFRDASHPRPPASRADGMVAAAAGARPKPGSMEDSVQQGHIAVHRHVQPAAQVQAGRGHVSAAANSSQQAGAGAGVDGAAGSVPGADAADVRARRLGILRHLWLSRAHTPMAKLRLMRRVAAGR
mmetsp:Transcript_23122/g.59067  ORF Transcript_23122/g.59067 Transcript_23122/m.59067 type:complete len:389 (-) Transcript_23122:194-1360(-)